MVFAAMDTDHNIYPPAIQKALRFLKEHDIMQMEPGRHPIDGEKMFAVVVDVDLAEPAAVKPEAHRTYIDIQYWPESATRFGTFPLTSASVITEAKPENDVWYYKAEADESFLIGRPDSFAIFFPCDVHRPDLCVGDPKRIRKCVVKVDATLVQNPLRTT